MRRWAVLVASFAVSLSGIARADEPVPLKVGFLGSYSGGAAAFGQETDTAIKVWQQQHGEVVAGRKIVFLRARHQRASESRAAGRRPNW